MTSKSTINRVLHQTGFSDFIRNATPEEKEKVYNEVMKKAIERQNKKKK